MEKLLFRLFIKFFSSVFSIVTESLVILGSVTLVLVLIPAWGPRHRRGPVGDWTPLGGYERPGWMGALSLRCRVSAAATLCCVPERAPESLPPPWPSSLRSRSWVPSLLSSSALTSKNPVLTAAPWFPSVICGDTSIPERCVCTILNRNRRKVLIACFKNAELYTVPEELS